MSSSLQKQHIGPLKAPESTVQGEWEEATTIVDIYNVHPLRPSLPVSCGRPQFCVSATSKKVTDACFINDHSAISLFNREDEKLLTDDLCQKSGLQIEELSWGDPEYFEKITKLQVYLDTVKKIVRPGCSQELLNVALSSMSSLARILSLKSSKPKL